LKGAISFAKIAITNSSASAARAQGGFAVLGAHHAQALQLGDEAIADVVDVRTAQVPARLGYEEAVAADLLHDLGHLPCDLLRGPDQVEAPPCAQHGQLAQGVGLAGIVTLHEPLE
jgi:hypothetical protein